MSAERILRFENESLHNEYEHALDVRARSRQNDYSNEVTIFFNLSSTFENLQEFLMGNIPLNVPHGVSYKINRGTNFIIQRANNDLYIVQNFLNKSLNEYKTLILSELYEVESIFDLLKNQIDLYTYLEDSNPQQFHVIKSLLEEFHEKLNFSSHSNNFKKVQQNMKILSNCITDTKNIEILLEYLINNLTNNALRNGISKRLFKLVEQYINCFKSISKSLTVALDNINFDTGFEDYLDRRRDMFNAIGISSFDMIIEQEKALFLEIIHLYLTGQSILKLTRKYPTDLFEKSKLTVDSFSGIVRYKFSEIHKVIIEHLSNELINRYERIINTLYKLNNFFNKDTFINILSKFSLWKRTFISLANKKVLFIDTRDDFHLENFQLNNLNEMIKDNIGLFTTPLINSLIYFQKLVDSYIVRLKMSLDDVLALFHRYKDKAKLSSNFIKDNFLIVDVFFGELSYSKITQRRAFNIEELLGKLLFFLFFYIFLLVIFNLQRKCWRIYGSSSGRKCLNSIRIIRLINLQHFR